MSRKVQAGIASLALAGSVVVLGVSPAYADSASGSQFCGSTQRVYLDTALSAVTGGATSNTTTVHNHVYGGADHFSYFLGFNTKRSYSGLSSSSNWYVSTTNPGTADFSLLADGCAAKPA